MNIFPEYIIDTNNYLDYHNYTWSLYDPELKENIMEDNVKLYRNV